MLFEIKNLKYSYDNSQHLSLSLASFHLNAGERVFVRGRSGSGKTTLLNLLSGVLAAPKDSVFYKGRDFALLTPSERDSLRASEMGIVFQQFNLVPFLTAFENVMLPLSFYKKSAEDFSSRASELFDRLELAPALLAKKVREMSVGQQQRVAVVRALLQKPHLILADEPTSSLDMEVRESFIQLLLSESQTIGAAVLFVSHDPGLESYFQRTLNLKTPAEQGV